MRKIILITGIISIGLGACKKEPQPLTKIQIQQKIDSITSSRIKESDERAQKDLELRITIEVKVKADSILKAQEQVRKKDTTTAKIKPVTPKSIF